MDWRRRRRNIYCPLNKEGKPQRPSHMSPLTFLNTIRKILSNILLAWITERAENYIFRDQNAIRRGRSTTEIAWTKCIIISCKFICQKIQLYRPRTITEDNGGHLCRRRTADTAIKNTVGESFITTIGGPQGDALSPILFIIYLGGIIGKQGANHPDVNRELLYAGGINSLYYDGHTERDRHEAGIVEECKCKVCRADYTHAILPQTLADSDVGFLKNSLDRRRR